MKGVMLVLIVGAAIAGIAAIAATPPHATVAPAAAGGPVAR
jgi:hypothetical protein